MSRWMVAVLMLCGSASVASAQFTAPLGPLSRDLLLARLQSVQIYTNAFDEERAHKSMIRLVKALETDAYYSSTAYLNKTRACLELLEQGDLATAAVVLEELLEEFEHLEVATIGAA